MKCKSCGYKVDRYGPDGASGKFCSCACKSYFNSGRKYPIQNKASYSNDSDTLGDLVDK